MLITHYGVSIGESEGEEWMRTLPGRNGILRPEDRLSGLQFFLG